MAKQCKIPGCNNPVFGKGYCKYHQYKRTDVKKTILRKSIKIRNEKLARNKYNFNPFKWGFKDEYSLFKFIWSIRPHLSELSKKKLIESPGSGLWINQFMHVLNKKKYPLFRYNPENIMLGLPIEHTLIDHASEDKRQSYKKQSPTTNFKKFYDKQEELRKQYLAIIHNKPYIPGRSKSRKS